tara:strand:+ start:42 stop:557 length:516 start_codon:yes stop_codon:yes gene_type:complete
MITKEQIEEELILALGEMENSGELTELNALKAASDALQRMKGRRRSKGSGDEKPDRQKEREREKPKPAPEKKKGNSLKNIPGPELQKTLNQLRNKGISGEKIGAMFDKAADEISKGAAGAPSIRRDFEQKDRPLINMMRDQVVAILNGDFASLKEGKIHNGTIAFFKGIVK